MTEYKMAIIKNKRRLALVGIDAVVFAAVYCLTVIVFALVDTIQFSNIQPIGYLINAAIFYGFLLVCRSLAGIYSSMVSRSGVKSLPGV